MDKMTRYLLDDHDIYSLLKEIRPSVSICRKKDMIEQNFFRKKMLYLILDGMIYIYTQNEYDEQELTTYFTKGQIFFRSILTPYDERAIRYGVCRSGCQIAAIDLDAAYQYLLHHAKNPVTLLEFAYESVVFHLEQRCHMLQQKSVRGKILAYVQYEAMCQGSSRITIKIPYSDLSNYLQVDRSSLMKELTKMDADGLLQKSGKTITLLEKSDRN